MSTFQGASSPDVGPLAQQALEASDCSSFFEDVHNQSPLECIEHFCRSHQSFQRLAYTQGIAAAATASTAEYEDCVELLLPLVQQLARDHEAEIRSTAVKQLVGLGTALYGKDAERSMRDIEATLLVCAQQCTLDDEDEVSHGAILAFEQLVQLLPSARATAASKRAVDRLESNGSDEGTLAAVRLLAHTVAYWTPEALRRHVPRYIGRWANHREFTIREAVATCMSLVIPPMPLRMCHQALLPALYQLSRDQNWRVRRACSLDLPRLAEVLRKRPQDGTTAPGGSCRQLNNRLMQPNNVVSMPGGNGNSQWQEGCKADQALGCCSSKHSSCLSTLQRYHTDHGGAGSSQQASSWMGSAGPQRNRSYPSLVCNRSPASTAEIMTKHPMHSSLIMDDMLSGCSSFSSMPGSPSGSSDVTSLAHDSNDDMCTPLPQHQQHLRLLQPEHKHHSSLSDMDKQLQQQHTSQPDTECHLEQQDHLLHDCWCALRQCMELLTADSSHWVKVAALSGLGTFLLQLPPCQVGQLLLGRFTSMAGSTVVIYEVSVSLACAQAFGQLAVLLGQDRWPEMRDAWHALQASRDPAVLCQVVSCLPLLAAALGPVLTHREVFPALTGLMHSHLNWISGHLVQVMVDLLEQMPRSGHEVLLKVLPELASCSPERSGAWRVRRNLALQLGRLAAVTGPEAIEHNLWPVAMSLCGDPIAAVRTAAASQIGQLLAALPPHILQSQLQGAETDTCAACRLSNGCDVQQQQQQQQLNMPAAGEGAVACKNVPGSAAAAGSCSWENRQQEPSLSRHGGGTIEASPVPIPPRPSRIRSNGLGVRFALDEEGDTPSADRSSCLSDSNALLGAVGKRSLLPGFAATEQGVPHVHSGCSSIDFDELELPSALAPAPAGCFSAGQDPVGCCEGITAATLLIGGSSASSSSSHCSNDNDSAVLDHSSSSDDESGNGSGSSDSDSHSDDEVSNHSSSDRWRTVAALQQTGVSDAVESKQLPLQGVQSSSQDTMQGQTDGNEPTPAGSTQRPLLTMHPAMMPVGALSAAAAAGAVRSSVMCPAPTPQRRHAPSRARSTGDLLRLPAINCTPSSPSSSLRSSSAVLSRFNQQVGSLPNGFLAVSSSSDDEGHVNRTRGSWHNTLPQPAHAAPHQYLPVLIEYFGCSSSHQQRQLYVPLVMSLLACCHKVLTCGQQAVLLDRLEALAHDAVPGVRYAVAAALADVRQQAAVLTSQRQQLQQEAAPELATPSHAHQAAEQHTQQKATGCDPTHASGQSLQVGDDHGDATTPMQGQATDTKLHDGSTEASTTVAVSEEAGHEAATQEECQVVGVVGKGAHPLLGYHAYVQQLASVTSPKHQTANSPCGSTKCTSAPQVREAEAQGNKAHPLPPRSTSRLSAQAATSDSQRRQRLSSSTSSSAAEVKALGAVTAAPQNAAVAVFGAGAAGGDQDTQAAEWLMKLSTCQQLERLMHVVALTTGPL